MFKLSQPKANTDISWGKGLWLGRSTLNNEIIIGIETGEVITVRTIRRLPPEEQQDQALLRALKGTPWSPKGTTEVENTLPEHELEKFRFASGQGGSLKGEKRTATQVPQQETETTATGGGSSSSGLKRPTTDETEQTQVRRRLMANTTGPPPGLPPPVLRPPPGLPPPQRPQSMDVEPTERPSTDVTMEEQDEEGNQKRMRILCINEVGILKKAKIGKKDKKYEETEVLLNEELEELAWNQETALDPILTQQGIVREA